MGSLETKIFAWIYRNIILYEFTCLYSNAFKFILICVYSINNSVLTTYTGVKKNYIRFINNFF